MEKAYDLKNLGEKLKAKGLPVLEDTAEKSVEAIFEWLKESAVVSKTTVDDMLALLYPQAEKMIKDGLIDKIDGEEG